MEPAKDRMRNHPSEPLDWACAGRVLPERNIFHKDSAKVFCVDRNQMISAFAPDRPDEHLSNYVRGTEC
jgi:hypothetical protein